MVAPIVLALLLATQNPPATLTADLNGDGSPEKFSATPQGKKIRLEVRDAAGVRLARAEAPAPAGGLPKISVAAGPLAGAGALVEVAAAGPAEDCRTVWRLRGRDLSAVPIAGQNGVLPDCAAHEGWTTRWDTTRENAPADYVRERSLPTADGLFHRLEVYRFSGFRLELDPQRSTAEIAGLSIPDWFPAILYPKTLLESLLSRFDLSPLRTNPRLRLLTDRDEGIFALRVDQPSGQERLPITAATPGVGKNEWVLTAGSPPRSGRVRVQLTADGTSPIEAQVEGLGEQLRRFFAPATRSSGTRVEIFPSAEDLLAIHALAGSWDSEKGERIIVTFVSRAPAVVDFGQTRVYLSIPRAPQGSDLLLLPHDRSMPQTALLLRGPDSLTRLPVTCSGANPPAPGACQVTGPGELFHRLGASVNVR
jgi:hypothetical protein